MRPSSPARPYRPAWWLPGRHAQTLWGRFARRLPRPATRRERWETPDGDFLDIDRLEPRSHGAPELVLLHGLEGTARSHYARGTLFEAQRRGWGARLLLFRTCGGTINRTRRLYHSGETTDLALVIDRVLDEQPGVSLVLAGYSLGGNVLLKWLGERGSAVPCRVRGAAAVSVPFDLARGSRHIQQGFARVYEAHFLRSLKHKIRDKLVQFPDLVDAEQVAAAHTLYAFDHVVTAPVHGFASADDYYARSSSIQYLERIRTPTLLVSAVDDPFLPSAVLDEVRTIAMRTPALSVEFAARGGHVGFVTGPPWRPLYWGERRVADYLSDCLAAAPHSADETCAPACPR